MGDFPQVGPTALLHCKRDAVAFLVMLAMCSLKLSLLSSVTPGNFTEVDKSTVVLPTTIGLRVHFLFHVNITTLVLSALTVRSFVWHQFMIVLMVLRVRSQMTSRSLPSARETMSSAKAWRYPGVSLGVCERKSSTTKFHRKGDRMPPWGHPLRILMVLEVFLWLMVIYMLVTMLMIQWAVAGSRLVFLIAADTALKERV